MNLFIDANIFLDFYHFSDDDLDILTTFHDLIAKTEELKIFLPSQVVDEFNRNRENKIQDALKTFDSSKINLSIPRMCTGYSEVEFIKTYIKDLNEKKKGLVDKLKQDIKAKNLKADILIADLFELKKDISENVIQLAIYRSNVGNPPGKGSSFGDSINWEFLLDQVPNNEDLYIVSGDGDYASPLNKDELLPFLLEEWQLKKNSKVYFYKSLNDFLKDKYPNLELVDEYLIDKRIEEFSNSSCFDVARFLLKNLSKIREFSDRQLNLIVEASINNDQIYNAHKYSPFVGDLLHEIINGRENKIDQNNLYKFNELFPIDREVNLDDFF